MPSASGGISDVAGRKKGNIDQKMKSPGQIFNFIDTFQFLDYTDISETCAHFRGFNG